MGDGLAVGMRLRNEQSLAEARFGSFGGAGMVVWCALWRIRVLLGNGFMRAPSPI
jgi:hypothetical protein